MENTSKLETVTQIIKNSEKPLVVTVSAAAGVTNQLKLLLDSELTEVTISEILTKLRERHIQLSHLEQAPPEIEEALQRLERLLQGISYTEDISPRIISLIMSFGERLIGPVLQTYLKKEGLKSQIVDAENLIRTSHNYLNAHADLEVSEKLIESHLRTTLSDFDVVIVPGFFGTSGEEITLLGRSGTDYSATILAYGLHATSITIWKDVHGFMSADPNLVDNAKTIPTLSYEEAAELAYFGAKLLHPRAASPARIRNIPIKIRHIDDMASITTISSESSNNQGITSAAHMQGLAIMKVFTSIGGNTKGAFSKISGAIEEAGGNPISVSTSQTCFAFLMPELEAQIVQEEIMDLGSSIIDSIDVVENMALIGLVGESMGSRTEMVHSILGVLQTERINIEMISGGATENAIQLAIAEKDLKRALEIIHKNFLE